MFVDDIIGISQKNRNKKNRRHVKSIILHAIDDVFHPLDDDDNPFCRELVSLKKLEKGDCSEHYQSAKYPCSILALSGYIKFTHDPQHPNGIHVSNYHCPSQETERPEPLHIMPSEPWSEWPPLHNYTPPSLAQLQ